MSLVGWMLVWFRWKSSIFQDMESLVGPVTSAISGRTSIIIPDGVFPIPTNLASSASLKNPCD